MLKPQAQIVTVNTLSLCIRPWYNNWVWTSWIGLNDSCKVAFETLSKCTWLFFCNKVKAGTTPAVLSFLKVQCVQTWAVLFHLGPKIRSCAPPNPRLTDQPRGCTAAPTLGSLASAAKVKNECIFLLHVTRLVMMLIVCQLHLFSVVVSTTTLVEVDDM